jgi:hypothetical protein
MGAPKGTVPPAAGRGRKRGSRNKIKQELREMVLTALDGAGGVIYLQAQATENPAAFMSLVGRCLPKDVNLKATVSLDQLLLAARESSSR